MSFGFSFDSYVKQVLSTTTLREIPVEQSPDASAHLSPVPLYMEPKVNLDPVTGTGQQALRSLFSTPSLPKRSRSSQESVDRQEQRLPPPSKRICIREVDNESLESTDENGSETNRPSIDVVINQQGRRLLPTSIEPAVPPFVSYASQMPAHFTRPFQRQGLAESSFALAQSIPSPLIGHLNPTRPTVPSFDESRPSEPVHVKRSFIDGNRYEGWMLDGQPHGKGKMFYLDGSHYEGDFRQGKKHGYGILIHPLGTYKGQFKDDLMHGKGSQKFTNGGSYEGDYDEGKKQGYGVWIYPNGDRYEGQLIGNQRSGKGKLSARTQDYEGEFLNDKFHGEGVLIGKGGSSYKGAFVCGKPEGKGDAVYPPHHEKSCFTGIFKRGQAYEGILRYKNGAVFEGKLINGQPSAQGIFRFSVDKGSSSQS